MSSMQSRGYEAEVDLPGRLRPGGCLLNQRRILLRELIDVRHHLIDMLNSRGLLLGGCAD